jgi:2-iminobutanoate/2-iminopropanoate deaminase
VPGLGHGAQPIPLAVKIDGTLYSGSVNGVNLETGTLSSDPAEQMACAFRNLATLMKTAGGDVADIAKVDVRLSDMALRDLLNREWSALFPDENDRPVRHVLLYDIGGGQVVQLEVTAHF